MWKILCITILCHLTLFNYVAAVLYVQANFVTELTIQPGNWYMIYDEETGDIKFLDDYGIWPGEDGLDGPFYYSLYFINNEINEGGSVVERLCGNVYSKFKFEDQRLHEAIVRILTGISRCPIFFNYDDVPNDKRTVSKKVAFAFHDVDKGLLINCGNSTAEVELLGETRSEEPIGRIVFNYFLIGPKCNNTELMSEYL